MAKFDEISRLYDETAAKVTESPEEWLKFVGTASNLYRYPLRISFLSMLSVLMLSRLPLWIFGIRSCIAM